MVVRKVTKRPGERSHTSAFTLVELLVGIAILLVLVALTFSLARSTRDWAKVSSCSSNLGQIAKALNLYAGDYNGFGPPAVPQAFSYPDPRTNRPAVGKGEPEKWKNLLLAYLKSDEVFYCPADVHARTHRVLDGLNTSHTHFFTSYANSSILGFTGWSVTQEGPPSLSLDSGPPVLYVGDSMFANSPGSYVTGHGKRAVFARTDGSVGTVRIGDK